MNGNTNINGRNLDFVINADTAYQKQYLEILLCHYVMLNVFPSGVESKNTLH